MGQPGRDLGLAAGPLEELDALVAGQVGRQEDLLEGDLAAQHGVGGAPHRAVAALADQVGQLVAVADHVAGEAWLPPPVLYPKDACR
ncbi:hypothetical protein GCM10029992_04420 [Glycomyces albus]